MHINNNYMYFKTQHGLPVAQEMFNSRRDYERCVRNQKRKRGGKKLKKNQQDWYDASDY